MQDSRRDDERPLSPEPERMLRCAWNTRDPLYLAYHDEEWGVPTTDDRRLFEFLVLEGAQAGLSWLTILRKRARYRRVFAGFEPDEVARFGARQRARLLADPGIIRNRAKIDAAVTNARAFLEVQGEFGCFAEYVWSFVSGEPRVNRFRLASQVPAMTQESEILSADLRARGFKFVGPTICYAFMQAVGLVNDHLVRCPRHEAVQGVSR